MIGSVAHAQQRFLAPDRLCDMLAAACALALGSTPKDEFLNALKSYANLDSFSATIEHHDDTGLFPGNYTQELRWRKDKRFDLKVTKKSDYKPEGEQQGLLAPDYFCDGTYVTSIWFGKPPTNAPVDQGPNVMPGWEVSGGFILSSLMRTRTLDWMANGQQGMSTSYAEGKSTEWKGQQVHEIVVTVRFGTESHDASLYLAPDGKSFVGMETDMNGKRGWMRYSSQSRNPKLPANVGAPPR